ncbi:MAG TPA: MarR family transcriptional regulator [Polyangiaceae bacterium]|nr:MarR family transcriptional regulator [Polyangiaceae bacterium]
MKDQFRDGGIVVENAIGFWIHRVYQASRNEMFREFREHGEDVTPEQWALLIRLWERDELTQSELSEATFRDAPTTSRIVAGMEARGLLERSVHPRDGRARIVRLTPRARFLRKKLVPVVERIVRRMVGETPEQELITTRATLRRMFDNLAS